MTVEYVLCPVRKRYVVSLTHTVVAMVAARTQATADDLYPMLKEEGFTRGQIMKALQNAKTRGALDSDGHQPRRGVGAGSGASCTTYRVAAPKEAPASRPRVSSVFQLGAL